MRPSEIRSLIGSTVVPNVPGRDDATTARYTIVSLGAGKVRLTSESGQAQSVDVALFGKWIEDGWLAIR